MKLRFLISVAAVLLLPATSVASSDLYTGEVVVESGATADTATFRGALVAVLTKHTADAAAARSLAEAAGAPEQLMLGYQFREVEVPRFDDDAETQRRLQVEFDPPSIDRLFAGQRVARWSPERPELLVWLVLEDEQGVRFMPPEADWLRFALGDGADRYGLFLEFPLYDAVDLGQVRPDDVRGGRMEGVLRGVSRYGTAGTLLVDLRHEDETTWFSRWHWIAGDRQARFEIDADSPEAVIAEALAQLAGQMAASYRPVADSVVSHRRLVVSGFRSDTHYAELLSFLEGLSMVSRVRVLRARGDQMIFGLDLNAGGLENAVALGRFLEQAPETATEPDALHYRLRW